MTAREPERPDAWTPTDRRGAPSRPAHVGDVWQAVPRSLRVGAAVGGCLLVIAAALYVIGLVVAYLAAIVVPVAVALLLAALLAPAVGYLVKRGVRRGIATALVLVGGLAGLGGVLTFVVITFVNGLPALQSQLAASIETITRWLTEGPLQLSPQQLSTIRDRLLEVLNANPAGITSGALTTAATVVQSLSEIVLAVFTLIFLLHGGAGIWQFLLRAAPAAVRGRVDVAGRRSLAALVAYVRATFAVAVVDAVGVGIGLFVLGIPLAVPLSALVFLAAFIPIVGALLAGTAAVLIALVANGVVPALILLGIVIAVMQLESHVLQPLLLGRAVKLHPLAVVLAIAAGLLTAGIAGALLAVPLLAVLNSGIRSLRSKADEHLDPAEVHASEPEESGPDEAGLDTEAGPKNTTERPPVATGNPRSRPYAPADPR